MILHLLLIAGAYLLLLLLLSPILTRLSDLRLKRDVILPPILLVITLLAIYSWDWIYAPPTSGSSTSDQFFWTVIISLAAFSLIKLSIWFVDELMVKPGHIRLPKFVLNIIGALVLAAIVLVALKTLFDLELTGILLTSTIASAIIGFSLQDTLGNLFSGLSLQLEAPFSNGDWVEIGGHEGQVVNQNWRSLMLLTRQNHRITLTNQFVASDKIINYSRPAPRQIQVLFIGLDYSHPPNRVKKIMIDFLNSVEECEYDPVHPPYVAAYDDHSIRYGLRFWIKDYRDMIKIQDIVYTRLWYIFKREAIHIPYPITVHKNVEHSADQFEEVPTTSDDIAKLLRGFDLLNDFEEEQILKISALSELLLYSKGEKLVHEGESGDSMFMIIHGTVEITSIDQYGRTFTIDHKVAGDFFGEMSLLTGEPRSANVTARTDVEAVVINKATFTDIIAEDPDVLEHLLDRLEKQKEGLENQRSGQDKIKDKSTRMRSRDRLLRKIKGYFGV